MATPGSQPTMAAPSSPIRRTFPLEKTGERPDPTRHAYRNDLADVALAGRVIASHFAAPLDRALRCEAKLRAAPGPDSEVIAVLEEGAPFAMLDSRGGWAWGYGGSDRRVGYVSADKLAG